MCHNTLNAYMITSCPSMRNANVQENYLHLLNKLKTSKSALNDDNDMLEGVLKQSNELFSCVDSTGGLKLDAKVTELHSDIFLKSFHRSLQNKKVDVNKFIAHLNENKLDGYFNNLQKLNKHCNFVSFIDFDYNIAEKSKRTCERIARTVKEAQTPSEYEITHKEANPFFLYLDKCLKMSDKLPIYECVLDIDSFDKTIENIFNLSIAIRSKIVEFEVVNDQLCIVAYKGTSEKREDHLVFDIDYTTYCKLRDQYKSSL